MGEAQLLRAPEGRGDGNPELTVLVLRSGGTQASEQRACSWPAARTSLRQCPLRGPRPLAHIRARRRPAQPTSQAVYKLNPLSRAFKISWEQ